MMRASNLLSFIEPLNEVNVLVNIENVRSASAVDTGNVASMVIILCMVGKEVEGQALRVARADSVTFSASSFHIILHTFNSAMN